MKEWVLFPKFELEMIFPFVKNDWSSENKFPGKIYYTNPIPYLKSSYL